MNENEIKMAKLEVEKKVNKEINGMVEIEMKKTGFTREEVIKKNKNYINTLKIKLTKKYTASNDTLRQVQDERIERYNREKRAKALEKAKEKEKKQKEKALMAEIDRKLKEKAQKRKELRNKKQKEKEDALKLSKMTERAVAKEESSVASRLLLQAELEREALERKKTVEESRNKAFVEEPELEHDHNGFWTREEELYLLHLKKKGVKIKDIAYLLDRSVLQVSFKLTELKTKAK